MSRSVWLVIDKRTKDIITAYCDRQVAEEALGENYETFFILKRQTVRYQSQKKIKPRGTE